MDGIKCADEGLQELALFAGAGGGILGGKLLGWRTVCAVEREPYAASVLMQRQNDGILDPFPIWDDVCTFDGKPWRGRVDVVSGGFPCQDISAAGGGAGIEGARSGLWGQMRRIVCEIRPRKVFVENSPMLTSRGLGVVLRDLAALGYNARWCVLGSHHIGACHDRDRIWIVADSNPLRLEGDGVNRPHGGDLAQQRVQIAKKANTLLERNIQNPNACGVFGVVDGLANRVDRLKAVGNGQFSAVAALAWQILSR